MCIRDSLRRHHAEEPRQVAPLERAARAGQSSAPAGDPPAGAAAARARWQVIVAPPVLSGPPRTPTACGRGQMTPKIESTEELYFCVIRQI
eukprot:5785553-Pyramimonas_sp.AAC.1